MQNRKFTPAAEFAKQMKIHNQRELVTNYVRFTHCNSELTWEKELRNAVQLLTPLLTGDKAKVLLETIKNSALDQLIPLFFTSKSHQDTTKHRVVFDRNKLDEAGLTAAVAIIEQKLRVMAWYLNIVHRPDKQTPWKINNEYQLQYESGSLSYMDRESDIQRATQIRDLLFKGLSPAAKAQGLTFDFTDDLSKSLTTRDGKGGCLYVLQHNEFVWKKLFGLASDVYNPKLAIPAASAAKTVFEPILNTDSSRCISFFLDGKSTLALALTNKAAAQALDTPEAKQLFRKQ